MKAPGKNEMLRGISGEIQKETGANVVEKSPDKFKDEFWET